MVQDRWDCYEQYGISNEDNRCAEYAALSRPQMGIIQIDKGDETTSDNRVQSQATNLFMFFKTKVSQLSQFYNDDGVLNRRIYVNINDYDNDPFGKVSIYDLYQP